MKKELEHAVNITQRAQRNYDLTKNIPDDDLKTLINVAINSPSKQNETHFKLKVFTDKKIIEKIHKATKRFALFTEKYVDKMFKDDEKKGFLSNDKYNVTNSQILANVVFVYCEDEDNIRGGTHRFAKKDGASKLVLDTLLEQKSYSMGISTGQLTLSAAMLGYRTGFCSAFDVDKLQEIISSDTEPKLIVGIGYNNENMDRRLHPTLKNKDVPEAYRNGDDESNWRFPSFEKNIKVTID